MTLLLRVADSSAALAVVASELTLGATAYEGGRAGTSVRVGRGQACSSKAEQTPPNRAAVRGPEFKKIVAQPKAGRMYAL